jgi:ABC-type branched-subunit amino acid transport system substrate-binding protein
MQIAPIESAVYSAVEFVPSAQSAVDRVNAAGGIGGRDVELISCNDKYDPNEALRCAKKAVQEDVVAVVGSLSAFGDQTAPILASKKIPVIGSNGLVPSDYTGEHSYLLDPGVAAYTGSPLLLKKFAGSTKIVTLMMENPSNAVVEGYWAAGAKKAGVEVLKNIRVPSDAIDWVTYIRQAESAGADGIVTSLSPDLTLKVWAALKSADLVDQLPIAITATSVGQQILDEAPPEAITNTYGIQEVPLLSTTADYTADYLADMKKIAPDVTPSSTGMRAWMSVQFFADVANTIDGDITATSVGEALDKVHGKDFMWIKGVSFDEPGPAEDAPRMFATALGAAKVTNGTYEDLGTIDPF